ncbi:MAG: type II toxin-antitoxin system RatA family toxin [Alphaproteobacteria bacterium]
MPEHSEIRELPFTAEQMYSVVADVESYPQFLPWCRSLNVLDRWEEDGVQLITAEMVVMYHAVQEKYVSRVRLDPIAREIEAVHIEGPFERLTNRWRFEPLDSGCRVYFFIDFAFSSWILSALAGIAFDRTVRRMADAFVVRAKALYG